MNYTINDGKYYKVVDVNTKEEIARGEIGEGDLLSTIHDVIWITEEEYNTEPAV